MNKLARDTMSARTTEAQPLSTSQCARNSGRHPVIIHVDDGEEQVWSCAASDNIFDCISRLKSSRQTVVLESDGTVELSAWVCQHRHCQENHC